MLADGAHEEVFEGFTFCTLAEFIESSFDDEFAVVDDADAVTKAFDDFEDVGGEEDGGAVADEVEQEVFHEAGSDGVDAFEGFIHEEELGTVDEGGGHGHAFAHAFGVFADEFATGGGEFEKFDEFFGAFLGHGAGEAIHAADEFEVFRAREIVEQESFIGDEADVLFGGEAGLGVGWVDGLTQQEYLARGGLSYPHKHFDSSGFTCPIGTEEAIKAALGDGET
jgi:hypothetical protein